MEIAVYLQYMLLCILILAMILFHAIHGVSRGKGWRLFIGAIVGALCCQIFDLFWGLIDYEALPVSVGIHRFICFLYYSSVVALSLWWFYYSEYAMGSPLIKTKGRGVLCALPYLFTNLVLLCPSEKSIFYIDNSNVYHRGNLYLLSNIVPYGYLVITACRALWRAMNKNHFAKRRDYLVLASFVIFPPCKAPVLSTFTPPSYIEKSLAPYKH